MLSYLQTAYPIDVRCKPRVINSVTGTKDIQVSVSSLGPPPASQEAWYPS